MLPLVLVDTLALRIEERIRVEYIARERDFVCMLDRAPLLAERGVARELLELA